MNQPKTSFRKLIIWLIFVIAVWAIATHLSQTKYLLQVLASGKWYWMFLAIICQFFFYPYYASYAQFIFGLFRVDFHRQNILPVLLASKFTQVALPISTFGQIAIFTHFGKKHDLHPLNVGIGVTFVSLFEIAAFIILSSVSILLLSILGHSQTYLLITYFILVIAGLLVLLFLLRLSIHREPPNRIILWIIRFITRMAKQKVDLETIEKIFLEIGSDLMRSKGKISAIFWRAMCIHFINLATFAFIYLAFAGNVNPLAILAGYVVGILFTIVSITPQGVGVAETAMISTLHAFGLSLSEAAVVTLAYRGLLYLIPVLPGFYFFSRLEFKKPEGSS